MLLCMFDSRSLYCLVTLTGATLFTSADAGLAKQLYEELSVRTLQATGQRIRVYLDVVRLEDGQRCESSHASHRCIGGGGSSKCLILSHRFKQIVNDESLGI